MKKLSNNWDFGKISILNVNSGDISSEQFKCENCGNYPALAIAGCCGSGCYIDGPYCQECWIGMIQAKFHEEFYISEIITT